MKVILLRDVPKLGRKLDALTVSDGYAVNFLFPKKFAEAATPGKIAELTKRKATFAASEEARVAVLVEKLAVAVASPLSITVKADDQGHLFKKIRADDIVEALKKAHDIELPEESVLVEAPLHEVGTHEVAIEAAGKNMTLTVELVKE